MKGQFYVEKQFDVEELFGVDILTYILKKSVVVHFSKNHSFMVKNRTNIFNFLSKIVVLDMKIITNL